MRKQRGFTLIEVFYVLIILSILGMAGVSVFILCHFVGKFW